MLPTVIKKSEDLVRACLTFNEFVKTRIGIQLDTQLKIVITSHNENVSRTDSSLFPFYGHIGVQFFGVMMNRNHL